MIHPERRSEELHVYLLRSLIQPERRSEELHVYLLRSLIHPERRSEELYFFLLRSLIHPDYTFTCYKIFDTARKKIWRITRLPVKIFDASWKIWRIRLLPVIRSYASRKLWKKTYLHLVSSCASTKTWGFMSLPIEIYRLVLCCKSTETNPQTSIKLRLNPAPNFDRCAPKFDRNFDQTSAQIPAWNS